jgi:5-oxoprolinase (ATP-hydrolysing)
MTSTDSEEPGAYERVFLENYRREFGFELTGRSILVDDIRVRAVGRSASSLLLTSSVSDARVSLITPVSSEVSPVEMVDVYFDGVGRIRTPVHYLVSLPTGTLIQGPAIIMQNVATVVIDPDCRARITVAGDIEIEILASVEKVISEALDPIYLSVFSHRFMGIAEQMGRTLQRTSISVNIKERLDFSCALFDPSGALVANAPHLPVHLGAMSEAVRCQVSLWFIFLSTSNFVN